MKRSVLTGLALVVLVPGLALAQGAGEGRGRRARPGPEGRLPPGVHRVDRPAPPRGEIVPEQAIRRLAAAVQGLSRRVERLEKGFGSLVKRLRDAHAARPDRTAARPPRGDRGARRDRAVREARGMWREGGSMGSGGLMPRFRQLARGVHGRFGAMGPMMKKAMKQRAKMMRRALMARRMAGRRGGPAPDARGPRRAHDAPFHGPAPKATDRRADAPATPHASPEAHRAAAVRAAKVREAARRARAARAAKPAAPAPADLVRKAQSLARENAKLRAELKKLQAQMKKLMEAVKQQQKRAAADRRS